MCTPVCYASTVNDMNEVVMGCIKHSMMFEAQMTAITKYSMFPGKMEESADGKKRKRK